MVLIGLNLMKYIWKIIVDLFSYMKSEIRTLVGKLVSDIVILPLSPVNIEKAIINSFRLASMGLDMGFG